MDFVTSKIDAPSKALQAVPAAQREAALRVAAPHAKLAVA